MSRTAPPDETAPDAPGATETSHPHTPIGRRVNVAPRQSGGASYATAVHIRSLGDFLEGMTLIESETGWRAANMVVSFGDDTAEDELIVVGVRWVNGAYHAEIR